MTEQLLKTIGIGPLGPVAGMQSLFEKQAATYHCYRSHILTGSVFAGEP